MQEENSLAGEALDAVSELLCQMVQATIQAHLAEEACDSERAAEATARVERLLQKIKYPSSPHGAAGWAPP